MKRITIAITGASGCCYALKLLQQLLQQKLEIFLLISDAAREVFRLEENLILPEDPKLIVNFFLQKIVETPNKTKGKLYYFTQKDWLSPVASGSNCSDAMVICPTSMGSLSAIAHGLSNNIIERAADVSIKEKKQLILVPREMPLSTIHLENMLKLSTMGVSILPASPGFYHQPKTLDDIVDFVVARILNQLGVAQNLMKPWSE